MLLCVFVIILVFLILQVTPNIRHLHADFVQLVCKVSCGYSLLNRLLSLLLYPFQLVFKHLHSLVLLSFNIVSPSLQFFIGHHITLSSVSLLLHVSYCLNEFNHISIYLIITFHWYLLINVLLVLVKLLSHSLLLLSQDPKSSSFNLPFCFYPLFSFLTCLIYQLINLPITSESI